MPVFDSMIDQYDTGAKVSESCSMILNDTSMSWKLTSYIAEIKTLQGGVRIRSEFHYFANIGKIGFDPSALIKESPQMSDTS